MQKEEEFRRVLVKLKEKELLLTDGEKQSEEYIRYRQIVETLQNELFKIKYQAVTDSDTGKKIQTIKKKGFNAKGRLSDREWQTLGKAVKTYFEDVYISIYNKTLGYPQDYFRICLLALFDLDSKEEAVLLDANDNNVRQNRRRLRVIFNIPDLKDLYKSIQN